MEATYRFDTIEQARNAVTAWLEGRGAVFGPQPQIEIGRLGGVSGTESPFWWLRLRYMLCGVI